MKIIINLPSGNAMKFLIAVASMSILTACAPWQYQLTPAEAAMDRTSKTHESAQIRNEACFASALANPEIAPSYKIVEEQIIFTRLDSQNKLSLMSSNAKITEPQKKALLTFLTAVRPCQNEIINDLKTIPSLSAILSNYDGDLDILYSNLISQKITIGEANQQKSKLVSKRRTDYAAAIQNLNNQLYTQINQESQANNQRRAVAAQFLMNQQAINAQQNLQYQQNQQNLLNQMNQNNPVTTRCNLFGNQVNCTSY